MTGAAIVPDGWAVIENHPGLQFLAPGTLFEPDPEAVPLGPADVPQILELIDLARPGPFLACPVALGGYVGVRWEVRLIATVSSHGDTRRDLRCTKVPTILLISCGQPLKLLGIGAGHEHDIVPTIEPGHTRGADVRGDGACRSRGPGHHEADPRRPPGRRPARAAFSGRSGASRPGRRSG